MHEVKSFLHITFVVSVCSKIYRKERTFKFGWLVCCFTSQKTAMAMSGRSVHLTKNLMKNLMKFCIQRYSIWVFTVCKSTHYGGSRLKVVRVKSVNHGHRCKSNIAWLFFCPKFDGFTLMCGHQLGSSQQETIIG